MRRLLALIFIAVLTPARAGFDARLVPAHAGWLLYAELTTMRASPVWDGREAGSSVNRQGRVAETRIKGKCSWWEPACRRFGA